MGFGCNFGTKHILETHRVDLELADECLRSPTSNTEDLQDAVREEIATEVLLRAFDEQNLAPSYRNLTRTREKIQLIIKAKQLLANDSYITEIMEWHQRVHLVDEANMPSLCCVAKSARRQVPGVIQALLETTPRKVATEEPPKKHRTKFRRTEKPNLEDKFESFLKMLEEKRN